MISYIFLFLVSVLLLSFGARLLVQGLTRIAKFLDLREFVVAFFVMAFAGAIPNLFIGFSSILHGIPQLSFADIVGGNVVDLTIAVALATLFCKKLPAESRTVQTTSIFTICVAILPLLLIVDGVLDRIDGLLLIVVFFVYLSWLFSKRERFTRIYDNNEIPTGSKLRFFLKDIIRIILGLGLLLLFAEGITKAATFWAKNLNLPLSLIGILIVGLGNSLPEIYFAVACAQRGESWMILGNLMGSVIVPSTLVLGLVALLSPIEIIHFPPFAIGRMFVIISALFFLYFIRSDREITKREAVFLLSLYLLFVLFELLAYKLTL
jgi:cation:H+ antiporter